MPSSSGISRPLHQRGAKPGCYLDLPEVQVLTVSQARQRSCLLTFITVWLSHSVSLSHWHTHTLLWLSKSWQQFLLPRYGSKDLLVAFLALFQLLKNSVHNGRPGWGHYPLWASWSAPLLVLIKVIIIISLIFLYYYVFPFLGCKLLRTFWVFTKSKHEIGTEAFWNHIEARVLNLEFNSTRCKLVKYHICIINQTASYVHCYGSCALACSRQSNNICTSSQLNMT